MSIHSQRRPWVVATIGLLALMAAACSGGATSDPTTTGTPLTNTTPVASAAASGTADPCSLVTSAEAQAAIGVAVATTKRKDEGGVQVCDYTSADGRTSLVVTLYGDAEDTTSFELAFAGQPVSGVGSDARFNADLSALAVLQNGTVVDVSMSNPVGVAGAQIQTALTTVAIAAIGRL
ncbi:MAG TPA: hypothetical protein VKR21_16445 [Solirubrobacteraceae bacterium]|nr:hypothetical protein [Solirubrobacteraceae bacterium]